MPAAPAVALALTDSDREAPLRLTRASSVRAGLAKRARIVLFAGDSTSNTRIVELVSVSRLTVLPWRGRDRFDEHGIDGLHDEARAGRPRHVSHERIITARLRFGNATNARCWREHSGQPWPSETFKFSTDPELVAKDYPGMELHLVMDNYATHKKAEVRDWLADNPRIHVHFTPTSRSWLNLVEVWFGIIQRQAIGRGTFTSVTDLTTKIRAFTGGWNQRSHPITWTKTADQVLAKANRQKTSNTSHRVRPSWTRLGRSKRVWEESSRCSSWCCWRQKPCSILLRP